MINIFFLFIIKFIGWIAIFLIGIKYYLQLFTFIFKKTSTGMSINYLLLNFCGYFLLSVSFIYKYSMQNGHTIVMTELTDVIMTSNGTIIVFILIILCKKYGKNNKFTFSGIFSSLMLFWSTFIYYILQNYYFINQVSVLECMGLQMMLSNFFKYISLITNIIKEKSVIGLNKYFLYCDLYGNILLLIQFIIDYILFMNIKKNNNSLNHINNFEKNYMKLFLSIFQIFNDLITIFLVKKYSNLNKFKNIKY